MSHFNDLVWTLPFFLYAETHYRFKYFFSLLRKREPEVIADAPHRVEPGNSIPLLILAKDAHRFPATLTSIKIFVQQGGSILREIELVHKAIPLTTSWWWNVYDLMSEGVHGWIDITVLLTLSVEGKSRTYSSDNHRSSSHTPLRVYIADEELPREPGMYFGDAHTHSDRTDDQVEFGVPIGAAVVLSQSMGLSYYCIADHSYDLDDAVDNFVRNDPELPKWKSLLQEIRNTNNALTNFAVIQGEEVTCRNKNGRNVHLLLFGDDHFFAGSGDGAERWLRTRSEHSIPEVVKQKQDHAMAFAAHPLEPVSFLQRWLLGRGMWTIGDLSNPDLAGFQFANGIRNKGFLRGYHAWTTALLQGKRVYCLAGNDAHGNFNRFRQIGIPFVRIRESRHQLFGKMRTAIFAQGPLDQSTVLRALAEGNFVITDGPVVNITLTRDSRQITSVGNRLKGSEFEFDVSVQSTKEFGAIKELKLFIGTTGGRVETIFLSERLLGTYVHRRSFSLQVSEPMYVRAEAYTSENNPSDSIEHFCFTNPVWLMPDSTS